MGVRGMFLYNMGSKHQGGYHKDLRIVVDGNLGFKVKSKPGGGG